MGTPLGPATGVANPSRADWMLRRLAAAGHRMTGARAAVVRAIAGHAGAVTAEQLVAELQPHDISRATVYRTLEVLERRGLLTRMHLDTYHGYTVCDDGHHHHLLCRSCGKVATVDAHGVEAEIHKLAEQLDFRVDTHTLEFSGLCRPSQGEAMPLGDSPAACDGADGPDQARPPRQA